MKTLLFTMEYPPFKGGVASYYYNLTQNWPEAGSLTVLFRKYFPTPFQYLMYFFDLRQSVKEGQIDQIIVGQILPLGTVALAFSLLFSKPYAVVLHGMDFPLALVNWRKRLLTRMILARAKRIICANSYVAQLVKEFSANLNRKVVIVNPGVAEAGVVKAEQLAALKKKYDLRDDKIILTMGRLVKRKGVDTMLDTINSLGRRQLSGWRYVVVGAGPDEVYLRDLCHRLSLDDLVVFAGESSEEDKWVWLELADIFALPARNMAGDFEGFGIVYLEANLVGKPVLALDSGGVHDAVVNNENGLLVEPDELVSALERLMDDAELRQTLGQKGQMRAQVNFNWKNQAQKFYTALNS